MPDDSTRSIAESFVSCKRHKEWDTLGQLGTLSDLRDAAGSRAQGNQLWQLLDIELEKYAFVVLSRITAKLESHDREMMQPGFVLHALYLSLRQLVLSGVCAGEAEVLCVELLSATGRDWEHEDGGELRTRFWWFRVLASTERALRLCFALQKHLAQAYEVVTELGTVLPVEQHAVDVFLEAELRASVFFQVSKLAQVILRMAKETLSIPNWVAICPGNAAGRCLRSAKLEDIWQLSLPAEGAIVFCDEASGEEEIAPGVRGVVVCRDLPVLSHLAVRARQTGVTFACTSEINLFEAAASFAADSPVRLSVRDNGEVEISAIGVDELTTDDSTQEKQHSDTDTSPTIGVLNLKETNVLSEGLFLDCTSDTVGAKAASSGKLAKIAEKGMFFTPRSCAIPFGAMAEALTGPTFEGALSALESALAGDGTTSIEESASNLRKAIAGLSVKPSVITSIQKAFGSGITEVAVRSSANSEDLENVSGAGLHDSVLGVGVNSSQSLEQAILQVWGSLFTLRAVQSRHAAKMPLYKGLAMGVLVQQMIHSANSTYAFIMFSENVAANDDKSVYIEMCVGLGETLASANVPGTPYRLCVQKEAPQSVTLLSLGSFSHALRIDPAGGVSHGLVNYAAVKLSTEPDFLASLAQRLACIALEVELSYGVGMDMEGVVIEDKGQYNIFLVQARPIVKSAKDNDAPKMIRLD
eukprot:gnl/MRDRNA2_/MRDRNA2_134853_c0_seq1.p1 gnl/MRDRNA2_/MRDRNA2_134853_c0~~gnl/MRDRNA2_/MRDRNA2_134853_c0_seq1.p1  ORF type:complete len:775 (+),score=151.03 gnl/MRDRNA2_/MRDRNA2_134853_c0_seq1:229-2325(+)